MILSLRLTLISLILIVLSLSPASFLIEKPGGFVSEMVRYTGLSLAKGIKDELSFFVGLREMNAENKTILAELARLKGELSHLVEVEQENEQLRTQLGVKGAKKEKFILAQVTGFSPEQGSSLIIINKGKDEGIITGDLVILGNYLVGMVERVQINHSLVRLINDPRFSIAALDQTSPDRPRGIVWGGLGSRLRMERILPGEQLLAGDLVVSSGLDGKFPRGLLLGEVTQVISSEGGILKEAELKLLFDPNKIEDVFIRK